MKLFGTPALPILEEVDVGTSVEKLGVAQFYLSVQIKECWFQVIHVNM